MKSKSKGFTLVELIIVIAIIAVLAVTAFLLLTKWISKSRDSRRLADIASIQKALEIGATLNTTYPAPDNNIPIYASGVTNVVGYQGDFGDNAVKTTESMKSTPKDPLDNIAYTYYVSADKKTYQLLYYTENTTAYNSNIAYAVDYSKRTAKVAGDKLGILVDPVTNAPVHRLGLTGLELSGLNMSYKSMFANDTIVSGTGQALMSMMMIRNKNLAKFDTGLVFYSDMETTTTSGGMVVLKDLSNYGNNGVCYNSTLSGSCGVVGPKFVQGKQGKAMQFDGNGIIGYGNVDLFTGDLTVSLRINKKQFFQDRFETLISKRDGWSSSYSDHKFHLMIWKNSPYIYMQKHGTGVASNSYLSNNRWIHIVYINKVGKNGLYYFDGRQDAIVSAFIYGLGNNSGFRIGGVGDYAGENLKDSYLDEVRIYNRALSDDEVRALYLAQ